MISVQFMEPVPENEIENDEVNTWYLPHHGVYLKQKQRIHVVSNCL